MTETKDEKFMIYHTVNDYRLKINRRIDMNNISSAIREAEYLLEYLKRTKTRQQEAG